MNKILYSMMKNKILCGRKHFEVIDTGIKYEVVKELKSLKDRSWVVCALQSIR